MVVCLVSSASFFYFADVVNKRFGLLEMKGEATPEHNDNDAIETEKKANE